MFASIVTTLFSQVKAGKRSAHPRAFLFPALGTYTIGDMAQRKKKIVMDATMQSG
jgi:hypothetical protein